MVLLVDFKYRPVSLKQKYSSVLLLESVDAETVQSPSMSNFAINFVCRRTREDVRTAKRNLLVGLKVEKFIAFEYKPKEVRRTEEEVPTRTSAICWKMWKSEREFLSWLVLRKSYPNVNTVEMWREECDFSHLQRVCAVFLLAKEEHLSTKKRKQNKRTLDSDALDLSDTRNAVHDRSFFLSSMSSFSLCLVVLSPVSAQRTKSNIEQQSTPNNSNNSFERSISSNIGNISVFVFCRQTIGDLHSHCFENWLQHSWAQKYSNCLVIKSTDFLSEKEAGRRRRGRVRRRTATQEETEIGFVWKLLFCAIPAIVHELSVLTVLQGGVKEKENKPKDEVNPRLLPIQKSFYGNPIPKLLQEYVVESATAFGSFKFFVTYWRQEAEDNPYWVEGFEFLTEVEEEPTMKYWLDTEDDDPRIKQVLCSWFNFWNCQQILVFAQADGTGSMYALWLYDADEGHSKRYQQRVFFDIDQNSSNQERLMMLQWYFLALKENTALLPLLYLNSLLFRVSDFSIWLLIHGNSSMRSHWWWHYLLEQRWPRLQSRLLLVCSEQSESHCEQRCQKTWKMHCNSLLTGSACMHCCCHWLHDRREESWWRRSNRKMYGEQCWKKQRSILHSQSSLGEILKMKIKRMIDILVWSWISANLPDPGRLETCWISGILLKFNHTYLHKRCWE